MKLIIAIIKPFKLEEVVRIRTDERGEKAV